MSNDHELPNVVDANGHMSRHTSPEQAKFVSRGLLAVFAAEAAVAVPTYRHLHASTVERRPTASVSRNIADNAVDILGAFTAGGVAASLVMGVAYARWRKKFGEDQAPKA